MKYQIIGDTTILYDTKGHEILIDTNQLEKVLQYNWTVGRKNYVRCTSRKIGRIPLHRYLLGVDKQVDHINRNPLDNRLSNLRLCTTQQNNMNRTVRKDSKSGHKGITIVPNRNAKYRARIQLNGRRMTIGYYETLEAAVDAYESVAKELFGEYAPPISRKF